MDTLKNRGFYLFYRFYRFHCIYSYITKQIQPQQQHLLNDDQTPQSPELFIAETLQTRLFKPSEFLKNLAQETLLSLAQNGSLLGLTHLLVLVLVVINRSMRGKAIKLSRCYVITVFSLVWLFLTVTHVSFSAMQYSAVSELDLLFSGLASTSSLQCNK